jgi:hypothetical protein
MMDKEGEYLILVILRLVHRRRKYTPKTGRRCLKRSPRDQTDLDPRLRGMIANKKMKESEKMGLKRKASPKKSIPPTFGSKKTQWNT